MKSADDKTQRRSSLTHFFSLSHHHEHVVRRRAQSLHSQSTRNNSILFHDARHPIPGSQPNTLDRKSILKLSISAPLSASAPSRPFISDGGSASSSNLRTSFIETRHHEDPPSSSERRVQFVEPETLPHHARTNSSHEQESSSAMHTRRVKKRTVARVSISTGKLYYIQEPIPEYPFPTTCSPPPPSPSHARTPTFFRRASYHHQLHTSRAGICPHLRGSNPGLGLHLESSPGYGMKKGRYSWGISTNSAHSEQDQDRSESPLYNSASEKFHAHWGMLVFNIRFSMFRAQDRMKDGVTWLGGIVRRIRHH